MPMVGGEGGAWSVALVVEEQENSRGLSGGDRLGEWHCSLLLCWGATSPGDRDDEDEYMVSSYGSSSRFTSPEDAI